MAMVDRCKYILLKLTERVILRTNPGMNCKLQAMMMH